MENGTIKKLTEKGFGFIAPEDGGDDLFFHSSALVDVSFDDLQEGTQVSYNKVPGDNGKGPKAENVQVTE